MSKLFSCFACTKKKKKQKPDDLSGDKLPLPKEKKQKRVKDKSKDKKGKKAYVDKQEKTPLNNEILDYEKNSKPNLKGSKQLEVHLDEKPQSDPSTGDFVSSEKHLTAANDLQLKIENFFGDGQTNAHNSQVPEVKINKTESKNSSTSSEGGASNADSCLTDSDLNISEAVFITEEGPKVGSLGKSQSRGGLHSMRATLENERFLEKELLDRVSTGSRNRLSSKSSHLRLSVGGGNLSKDDKKLS